MTGDGLGTGWAFPVGTDASGDVALTSGEADVEAAIRIVLETAPGERVMRPEFGCGIHEHTFCSVTPGTRTLIESEVREALERWEPRIDVEAVAASTESTDTGTVNVHIEYRIRRTDSLASLSYPLDLTVGDT